MLKLMLEVLDLHDGGGHERKCNDTRGAQLEVAL